MRVTVVGTGYVGLVSGACLADFGHTVTCVDIDHDKVDALNLGNIHIFEPGLKELVTANMREGRLVFTTNLGDAVAAAAVVMIAVGTPSRRGDGFADLSYIFAAAQDIARAMDGFTVVVTKSTVPVGTGDEIERIIRELRPDSEFAVVSNPEFLREGAAISDFKRPDRIVVGTSDQRARAVIEELYRPLFLNASPTIYSSRRTSEVIKYASNALLATKVAFINEIADLCEAVGANVQDVARAVGMDNRIGPKFLNAGPGFGGSCFPKDARALIQIARQHDVSLQIVEAVVSANNQRKLAMAQKVITACGGSVEGKRIAVLGLTFKPNTDDMREAPAIDILTGLCDAGAAVVAYDPAGMDLARPVLPDIGYAENPYACLAGADALVIITEWDAFRALDLDRVRREMRNPLVVDLRNIYRSDKMRELGFSYVNIGGA